MGFPMLSAILFVNMRSAIDVRVVYVGVVLVDGGLRVVCLDVRVHASVFAVSMAGDGFACLDFDSTLRACTT